MSDRRDATVGVFGLGDYGCVSAACPSRGHPVAGLEVNADKVKLLRQDRSPVVEERIQRPRHRLVGNGPNA